ncbi:MAG: hypothetical protein DIU71_17075 [Proteobacteria bacterium]|nr:MAG: hypothetical protein DIU71_17075 [Pseudomonadota bacterium]
MREDWPVDVSLQEKVQALHEPRAYDHPVGELTAIETHFAWVFLTDSLVYKLKKPVHSAMLDLGTLDARLRNCREELRLNRRLAVNVYLDVVALVRTADGSLRLGASGEPVEWLVKMRRLPEERMLDRAMAEGGVDPADIERVGRLLADFYHAQPPVDFRPAAYAERLLDQVHVNRRELLAEDLGLSPAPVEELAKAQRAAARALIEPLAERARRRRIVEAHGDLRPEHVFLGSPPCVIDCLEFSRDLRLLDPCEEIAYLTCECDLRGFDWIGPTLLGSYLARTDDAIPTRLFDFYCSHRATVRAKIVAWHIRDRSYRDHEPWAERATKYLRYAQERLTGSCVLG